MRQELVGVVEVGLQDRDGGVLELVVQLSQVKEGPAWVGGWIGG